MTTRTRTLPAATRPPAPSRRGVPHARSGAVDVSAALNLVGALVTYFAPAFLLPVAVALIYGEPFWPFLVAGAGVAAFGLLLERATSGKDRVGSREGYLVVALVWLLVAVFGAVPYLLAGEEQLASPVDALFESMSGFTTTGSSVLVDIPALDRSLLMWRQFTQWVGGIGIVVLALAILPRLRVGGRQALFRTESPGPELETLSSTIRQTAQRFLGLYAGLTIAQVTVLAVFAATDIDGAMTLFDAVAHSFTTIPTGGFSPRARSLEEFGAATQWAIAVFMVLGGTSFALLYLGLLRRRPRAFLRDEEFRAYVVLMGLASAVLATELVLEGLASGEAAVRQAVFTTVSIVTTTGYANADFNEWTALASLVIVGGFFVSASAGSTSGGIKLVRHLVIGKLIRREIEQTIHPELIVPIRVSRAPIDEQALRAIVVFGFIYVGLAAAGTLTIMLDSAAAGVPVSPFEALAAAGTTIGNVGPGLGFAGPMGSFDPFSEVSKGVMIALMWLGRLEIVPILVLLTRSYWRV